MNQPEDINNRSEAKKPRQSLRATGAVALIHASGKIRHGAEDIAIRRVIRSKGFETRLVADDDARQALELEIEVWREKGYPGIEDYEKYLPQSRIFAAFADGSCVGMNRLFAGSPETPPFIQEMPMYDELLKQKLTEGAKNHKVEEFGTVAVDKELRNGRVFLDFCRQAYRDATTRGIEIWGIIMEPERVQQMNRLLSFTFEQVGPAKDYQGGDCAAHIMDLHVVRAHMSSTKPDLYDWFINEPA